MLFTDAFDLRRDLLCEDGVVLLEYTIRIPIAKGDSPLQRALGTIADRTEAYLQGILAEALRAEYLSSSERLRRFTFRRASYLFSCEVHSPTQLLREVRLLRAGRTLHAERVLWECSEKGIFSASHADSL